MTHPVVNNENYTSEQLREVIEVVMSRRESLCPEFFDDRQILLPDKRAALLRIADFMIDYVNRIFVGVSVKDILLNGGIAGYIYTDRSDIDIIALLEPDPRLISAQDFYNKFGTLSAGLINRGYCFTIGERLVDYGFLSVLRPNSGVYSLRENCWRSKPVKADFPFTANELQEAYIQYEENINAFVRELPKYDNDMLTFESAQTAQHYARKIRETALNAKKESIYNEYCLDYCLYRCFRKLGQMNMLEKYITDSYSNHFNHHI